MRPDAQFEAVRLRGRTALHLLADDWIPGGKTPGLTIAELKELAARLHEDILRLRDDGDGLSRDRRPSFPAKSPPQTATRPTSGITSHRSSGHSQGQSLATISDAEVPGVIVSRQGRQTHPLICHTRCICGCLVGPRRGSGSVASPEWLYPLLLTYWVWLSFWLPSGVVQAGGDAR
jgi:hypothetical protein